MPDGWMPLRPQRPGLDAANITFTPGTAGDWETSPDKTDSALDELADRLTDAESEQDAKERQSFAGTKGLGWSTIAAREDGWAPISKVLVPVYHIQQCTYEKVLSNTGYANTHMGTMTIPGNLMGPKGYIEATWAFVLTNGSASDDDPDFYVFGQPSAGAQTLHGPLDIDLDAGEYAWAKWEIRICNLNNTSAQYAYTLCRRSPTQAAFSASGLVGATPYGNTVTATMNTTGSFTLYMASAWDATDASNFVELIWAEARLYRGI